MMDDALIHVPEWMYRTAEAIANMPFRAEFYERDIAVQIAKHIPSNRKRQAGMICLKDIKQFKEEHRQYQRDVRSRRIEQGLCWRCGKDKEQTKKRLCNFHLEQDRQRKETAA